MRIKDPLSEPEEPFNLVPLTDMVFNLLIFFMAATTFAQVEKEIGIHLPKASSFVTLSSPPKQMVINIDKDGRPIVYDAATGGRKPVDDDRLLQMVSAMVKQNKDSSVLIYADERGSVKNFARVIDDCKRSGIQEAKIVYLGTAAAK
jgi:biopolymer transport protein ExbD